MGTAPRLRIWLLLGFGWGLLAILISIDPPLTHSQAAEPPWKGSIRTENGVEIVKNPSTPIYRDARLDLQEEFIIRDSERTGHYLFVRPESLLLDANRNLYVCDARDGNIKVFDERGRLIRVIGRKGPGPGELIDPAYTSICHGQLSVYSSQDRRLTFFDLNGKYITAMHSPALLGQMKLDSSGNAFAIVDEPGESGKQLRKLQKFDPKLKFVKTLASDEWVQPQYLTALATFGITRDDRIVYGNPDRYEFMVFGDDGRLLRKVQKDWTPARIPKEEIDYLKKNYPPWSGTWDGLPEYYPAYYQVYVDGEGKTLVETRYTMAGNQEWTWDVFSPEGKFLTTVKTKRFSNCLWANQRLYAIEEDSDGFLVVKAYRVKWSFDRETDARGLQAVKRYTTNWNY